MREQWTFMESVDDMTTLRESKNTGRKLCACGVFVL